MAGKRGKRIKDPLRLYFAFQCCTHGGGGNGLRFLSGRRTGYTQQSGSYVYSAYSGAYYPQCAALEKKPSVHTRHFTVHSGNQYAEDADKPTAVRGIFLRIIIIRGILLYYRTYIIECSDNVFFPCMEKDKEQALDIMESPFYNEFIR